MTVASWWIFACATALIAATPGPNMIHVMTMSARHGFARAFVTMAGCLSAVILCVTASSLGLGALLTASRPSFEILRWVGIFYLVWLGWKSWRTPVAPTDVAPGIVAVEHPPLLVQYRLGLFTGLSNPKLIVFAAAFFPQFIRADFAWGPQFAILVATFAVIEVACYLVYALGGRSLAGWLSSARRRRLFNRATGSMFFAFGAGLFAYRA